MLFASTVLLGNCFPFQRVLVPKKGKSSKPTASDSDATGFAKPPVCPPFSTALVMSAFSQPQPVWATPGLAWAGRSLSVRSYSSLPATKGLLCGDWVAGLCVQDGWKGFHWHAHVTRMWASNLLPRTL